MTPTIETSVDATLIAKLAERFKSQPEARLRIEIVDDDGVGVIWVEAHFPGEPTPRRMTLGQALQFSARESSSAKPVPTRLGGRPLPAAVRALSGAVTGAMSEADAAYKRHVLRKHSR